MQSQNNLFTSEDKPITSPLVGEQKSSFIEEWKKVDDFKNVHPAINTWLLQSFPCQDYIKELKYINVEISQSIQIRELQLYGLTDGSTVLRIKKMDDEFEDIANFQTNKLEIQASEFWNSDSINCLWLIPNRHCLEAILQQACRIEPSIKFIERDLLSYFNHEHKFIDDSTTLFSRSSTKTLLNILLGDRYDIRLEIIFDPASAQAKNIAPQIKCISDYIKDDKCWELFITLLYENVAHAFDLLKVLKKFMLNGKEEEIFNKLLKNISLILQFGFPNDVRDALLKLSQDNAYFLTRELREICFSKFYQNKDVRNAIIKYTSKGHSISYMLRKWIKKLKDADCWENNEITFLSNLEHIQVLNEASDELPLELRNERNHLLLNKKAHASLSLASGFTVLFKYKKELYEKYRELLSHHADFAKGLANAIRALDNAIPFSLLNADSLQLLNSNPSDAKNIASNYINASKLNILIKDELLIFNDSQESRPSTYLTIDKIHLSEKTTIKIGTILVLKLLKVIFDGHTIPSQLQVEPSVTLRIGRYFLNNINEIPDLLEDEVITVLQNLILLERDIYWETTFYQTDMRLEMDLNKTIDRNKLIKTKYNRSYFESFFNREFNAKNPVIKYHYCFLFIAEVIGMDALTPRSDGLILIETLQKYINDIHINLIAFDKANENKPGSKPSVYTSTLDQFIDISERKSQVISNHCSFLTSIKAKLFHVISHIELCALKEILEKIHSCHFKTSKTKCLEMIQYYISQKEGCVKFFSHHTESLYELLDKTKPLQKGKFSAHKRKREIIETVEIKDSTMIDNSQSSIFKWRKETLEQNLIHYSSYAKINYKITSVTLDYRVDYIIPHLYYATLNIQSTVEQIQQQLKKMYPKENPFVSHIGDGLRIKINSPEFLSSLIDQLIGIDSSFSEVAHDIISQTNNLSIKKTLILSK